jgi:aminoglycoside phosphotransferase (APT) family kinase protein
MSVDPRDATAVAATIAGWAANQFDGDVAVAGTPARIGAGFDSYIHAVELAGAVLPDAWQVPLIVRLLPSPDRAPQAAREAAVQSWSAGQGYVAPQVLAVLAPDDGLGLPTQIMERAPGITMLEAFSTRPWQARRLVDQLAGLAIRLHALDPATWPEAADPGQPLVDQRLSLPRRVVAELDRPDLARALERAEALAPAAMDGPRVVCHGDFHPLNVVVEGDHASVIDWTDAGLGPREADVARTVLLFHVASIAATSAIERAALKIAAPWLARRYRRTYEGSARLDAEMLARWEVLHAVHGWSQVEMLHAGGFDGASSADPSDVPPEVAAFLRARVDTRLEELA